MKYNIAYFKRARMIFADGDSGAVAGTYAAAVSGARAALRYLGVKAEFPLFNVFIAPARKDYDSLVSHLTAVPTDRSRVGQPQAMDLYILSPNAYPKDALPEYLGADGLYDKTLYRRFIAHEMTHMAEEFVSPRGALELRPQWWAEGLAVLVSGQYKEKFFRQALKKGIKNGEIPSLRELTGANAYIWGWTIIRYMEAKFGKSKILSITAQTTKFSAPEIFGMSERTFENGWKKSFFKPGFPG